MAHLTPVVNPRWLPDNRWSCRFLPGMSAADCPPPKRCWPIQPATGDYWHWPTASRMLKEADRIGFDHQVQYGMWKGYGGATQWNDAGLDFATAAAASATVTQRMNLFSTVHVSFAFHPMHIAKMGACIDFISGGRWGLNIVTGLEPGSLSDVWLRRASAGTGALRHGR